MNKDELIKKHGIKGALTYLRSKLPPTGFPKVLRDKTEYVEINKMIKNIKSSCSHKSTRSECVDFHRRDFGTICNDCGKFLNTNG